MGEAMLEKVARAIKSAFNAESKEIGAAIDDQDAMMLARAAIEAMREPPEYVLDAMNPSGRYAGVVVPEAWNDAIDAILSSPADRDG